MTQVEVNGGDTRGSGTTQDGRSDPLALARGASLNQKRPKTAKRLLLHAERDIEG